MAKRIPLPARPAGERMASRELGRALKSIRTIQTFCYTNTLLGAGGVVLGMLAGSNVMIGVFATLMVVTAAAASQVRREPFAWTIVLAALWTVLLGLRLAQGPPFSVGVGFAVLWTLGCWGMVPVTARVKRLIAQYPDLRASRALRPGGRAARRRAR